MDHEGSMALNGQNGARRMGSYMSDTGGFAFASDNHNQQTVVATVTASDTHTRIHTFYLYFSGQADVAIIIIVIIWVCRSSPSVLRFLVMKPQRRHSFVLIVIVKMSTWMLPQKNAALN